MFMLCLCLRYYDAYLNSTSNVSTYLLIIFLRRDWFGFFLNEETLDPPRFYITGQMTPLSSN